MLLKGMNLSDLSILTGWDLVKLQPYARRAREKQLWNKQFVLTRSLFTRGQGLGNFTLCNNVLCLPAHEVSLNPNCGAGFSFP